ncbi:MAG: hypothetical protein KJ044_11400, partial [Planctomycetes bacterium]|nr:hypothetical protein [Planctomycetota bacterium]
MNEPEQPIEETADDATSAGDIIAASAIPQDALAAKLEALLFVHSRPVSARRPAQQRGLTRLIPLTQAREVL